MRNLVIAPLVVLVLAANLGNWYGDAAIRWMERKSASYGGMLRTLERWFSRHGYVVVFIAPNNPVCLLAGAAAMPVMAFAAANVAGTITRLVLIRVLGDLFDGPLDAVRHFIATYRIPLLAVGFAAVAITVWSDRRRGGGEIIDLVHMDDEIHEIEASDSGPTTAPSAETDRDPA
jgi:membrane protein DedA with SNARE-associated domain